MPPCSWSVWHLTAPNFRKMYPGAPRTLRAGNANEAIARNSARAATRHLVPHSSNTVWRIRQQIACKRLGSVQHKFLPGRGRGTRVTALPSSASHTSAQMARPHPTQNSHFRSRVEGLAAQRPLLRPHLNAVPSGCTLHRRLGNLFWSEEIESAARSIKSFRMPNVLGYPSSLKEPLECGHSSRTCTRSRPAFVGSPTDGQPQLDGRLQVENAHVVPRPDALNQPHASPPLRRGRRSQRQLCAATSSRPADPASASVP